MVSLDGDWHKLLLLLVFDELFEECDENHREVTTLVPAVLYPQPHI